MREILVQFATWQDQITHVHQSVFGNLLFTRSHYYQRCPDLLAFCEGIKYVVKTYYEKSRQTQVLRDEDSCLPYYMDSIDGLTATELNELLHLRIVKYENAPKTGDKVADQVAKDLLKCLKMAHAFVVIVMFTFDFDTFEDVFGFKEAPQPEQAEPVDEKTEEPTGKSKKKKNKKKNADSE